MTRPILRFTPRFFLPFGLCAAVFLAGCEESKPTTSNEAVPYDPAKSKSQEDSMKRAAEASRAASKK